jgi:hypothetical protein
MRMSKDEGRTRNLNPKPKFFNGLLDATGLEFLNFVKILHHRICSGGHILQRSVNRRCTFRVPKCTGQCAEDECPV